MDYTNDEFIYELKRLDEINRRREIVRLSGGVVLPINSNNFPNLSNFINNSKSFNDIEEFAFFLDKFRDYLDSFVFVKPEASLDWSGKTIRTMGIYEEYLSDDCNESLKKEENYETLAYFLNKYPEHAKEIKNVIVLNSGYKYLIDFIFKNIDNFDLLVSYAKSVSGKDITEELLNSINSYASEYIEKTLTNESNEKDGDNIVKYLSFLENNNYMFVSSNYVVRYACKILKDNTEAKIIENAGLAARILNAYFEHMSSEISSALLLKDYNTTKRMSDLSVGYSKYNEYDLDGEDGQSFCDSCKDFSLEEINKITFFSEYINSFINRYKEGFKEEEEENRDKETDADLDKESKEENREEENKGENKKEYTEREKYFNSCLSIFELYLSKCDNPSDLCNSLPNKLFSLLSSKEFLAVEHKNRLENLYRNVFLDKHRFEIEEKMKNLLKENIDSYGRDFIQRIEDGENLNDFEFEKLKEYIIMSKAVNLSIDEKLVDYSFKHLISNSKVVNNGFPPFERLIACEKGQELLRKFNIFDYIVVERGFSDNSSGKHLHGANEIIINSDYRFMNPEMEIETLFHEVQHAKQFEKMSDSQVRIYEMFKDLLIQQVDRDYYDKNYSINNYEIDANLAQKIRTIEYYKKLGINKEYIDKKENEYQRELKSRNGGLLRFNFDKLDNIYKEKIYNGSAISYENVEKRYNTREYIFKEVVKALVEQDLNENPSDMSKVFIKCPTALMEFHQDGTRKNRVEILQDYMEYCRVNNIPEDEILVDESKIPKYFKSLDEEFIEGGKSLDEIGDSDYDRNRNIEALYVHILNTEPFLDNDDVIEEMNQINNLKIESKKMNFLLDSIIERDMLSKIDLWITAKRKNPELFNDDYIDEKTCYILVQLLNTYSAKIEQSNPLMSQRIKASIDSFVRSFSEQSKKDEELYR